MFPKRPTDTHPVNTFILQHKNVLSLLLFNVKPSPFSLCVGEVPHQHALSIDYDLLVSFSLHWSEDLRTLAKGIQLQNPSRVLQVIF